jgi:hypothetical protein
LRTYRGAPPEVEAVLDVVAAVEVVADVEADAEVEVEVVAAVEVVAEDEEVEADAEAEVEADAESALPDPELGEPPPHADIDTASPQPAANTASASRHDRFTSGGPHRDIPPVMAAPDDRQRGLAARSASGLA